MLSEREQRLLDDIELRMALEDPHFVAVMSGCQAPSWRRIVISYLATVTVILAVVLTFLARLYVASACVASAAAAVLLGYGLASWHRHRARRRFDGRFA
jgi:lysylphosphatidylglycerol synthetase-like protein (DUF2156 family)